MTLSIEQAKQGRRYKKLLQIVGHAEGTYERWLQRALLIVRDHKLIPYCDKHGLSFAAGNGEYMFFKDGKRIDLLDTPLLSPALQLALDLEVYYGRQVLGSLLEDYEPTREGQTTP